MTQTQTNSHGQWDAIFGPNGEPPADMGADPADLVRLRATRAIRRLNALLLTADADGASFEKIADGLEEAVATLESEPSREPQRWENNATIGVLNAAAPVLIADPDPEDPLLYRCRTTFGLLQEGPDGLVHGGVLAKVLDHCCGAAAALAGIPTMTGTLTLRYERPSRLGTELVLTGRVERTEGRKSFVTGGVSADGEMCVRFEAIMIQPRGGFPT